MAITKENIKLYLRIDYDKEDSLIEELIENAQTLIEESTGVKYVDGDKTYELLIKFLVQHYYDNRSSISEKAVNEVPYTITELMRKIGVRGAKNEQG